MEYFHNLILQLTGNVSPEQAQCALIANTQTVEPSSGLIHATGSHENNLVRIESSTDQFSAIDAESQKYLCTFVG